MIDGLFVLAFHFTYHPDCAYEPSGTQVINNLLRAFPQRLSDLSFHLLYIPFSDVTDASDHRASEGAY